MHTKEIEIDLTNKQSVNKLKKYIASKKRLDGENLGKLVVASQTYLYIETEGRGNPNPEPLLTEAQIDKFINRLENSQERAIYNNFASLQEWINLFFNIASAREQQVISNFKTLHYTLNTAITLEELKKYTNYLPVIRTQQEREEEKNKWEEGTELCNQFAGYKGKPIAILEEDTYNLMQINGKGEYKTPFIEEDIERILEPISLSIYFPQHREAEFNRLNLINARNGLLLGYYYLKGFNRAIRYIADVYNIPFIKHFFFEVNTMEAFFDEFNSQSLTLQKELAINSTGNTKLEKAKEEVLENLLGEIEYRELEPTEENKEQALNILKQGEAFSSDDFINLLALTDKISPIKE